MALKHEAGVLAVGAATQDVPSGVLYIYQQDTTGKFVQRARLLPSDSAVYNAFGSSISMTNAIIVVGAPGIREDPPCWGLESLPSQQQRASGRKGKSSSRAENQPGERFGHAVAVKSPFR